MAMAVRIVRAAAGRDKVVLCGYHGWHDWHDWHDWCLAANLGGESLGGHLLPGLDLAGVTAALGEVERNWPRPMAKGDIAGRVGGPVKHT